jgi:hypothetical protein
MSQPAKKWATVEPAKASEFFFLFFFFFFFFFSCFLFSWKHLTDLLKGYVVDVVLLFLCILILFLKGLEKLQQVTMLDQPQPKIPRKQTSLTLLALPFWLLVELVK